MVDSPLLKVEQLSKSYGRGQLAVAAFRDLSFSVNERELMCIVGPSGCGKTTLLKCLSGLLAPTSGNAVLDGKVISGPPDGLAFVSQDYSRSLLPWMTVLQNVVLPLRAKGVDRETRTEKALGVLERVGLGGFSSHFPWQLSGGMQQRVAIARALAFEPRLLLMDEPFAAVDAQSRADLEDLVQEVWAEFQMTILVVTHDIDEAVYLSDRILVLSKSPAVAREVMTIDLARPRHQIDTKAEPKFSGLRAHTIRLIKEQPSATDAASPSAASSGVK